jgi:hypothetical protein
MSDETTPNEPIPVEADAPAKETSEAKAEAADPTAEAKPARAPKPKADAADGEKPARAPKKEKAPALEDKPFADFITQDFIPALKQTLAKVGISDLDLKFEKRKLPISGLGGDEWWQVIGHWQDGHRQFIILFSKEDIQAPKFFCYADNGAEPSTIESFMIDERRVSLDLLLLYAAQRLNGQKWLVRN